MNRKYNAIILLSIVVVSTGCITSGEADHLTTHSNEISVEQKIDPLILEKMATSNSFTEQLDVIILLNEDCKLVDIDILKQINIIKRFDFINGFVAHVSLDEIFDIAEIESIESIWLDRPEVGIPSSDMNSNHGNLLLKLLLLATQSASLALI